MGKLFLHVGRNKAGSTTVQNTWLGHLDRLRAASIDYVLFGQPSPPGLEVDTLDSHLPLVERVRGGAGAVLVSHEGLCCFHPTFAQCMAADLAPLDVELIFYVRRYRSWAVSDYAFNLLIGAHATDFDGYLAALGDGVSFWPGLRVWGDAIGWDRVRVRSLHPGDLVGGDLASDAMAAIGLALPPGPPVARANASPSWLSVEVLRVLLADPLDQRPPAERHGLQAVLSLNTMVDEAVRAAIAQTGGAPAAAAYLTAAQSERLRDRYNADLALLAARTGTRLRDDDGDGGTWDRPFLPEVGRAPPDLLRAAVAALRARLAGTPEAAVVGEQLRALDAGAGGLG